MASASNPGYDLVCIRCGKEGAVQVNLNNLDRLSCAACGREFNREDVRAHFQGPGSEAYARAWERMFRWLDSAPEAGA